MVSFVMMKGSYQLSSIPACCGLKLWRLMILRYEEDEGNTRFLRSKYSSSV